MKRGGGGFDFDTDILKEQQKNIDEMNSREHDAAAGGKSADKNEGKSLAEIMKEKREANEQFIGS